MANTNAMNYASAAATKAKKSKGQSTDYSIRYLAETVEQLALAVQEVARQQS